MDIIEIADEIILNHSKLLYDEAFNSGLVHTPAEFRMWVYVYNHKDMSYYD